MTKREGAFLVIIFFLLNIIAGMICWAWQQKVNEEIMFDMIRSEISAVKAENVKQDKLIDNIIMTEAMRGKFDK